MCTCVCMHVCMHVCGRCVCACVCVRHMRLRVCLYVCVRLCVDVCLCARDCVCMCICKALNIRVRGGNDKLWLPNLQNKSEVRGRLPIVTTHTPYHFIMIIFSLYSFSFYLYYSYYSYYSLLFLSFTIPPPPRYSIHKAAHRIKHKHHTTDQQAAHRRLLEEFSEVGTKR